MIKLNNKKGFAPLLILLFIIFIIYFGFFYQASILNASCELGTWGISGYNSQTGEINIPVDIQGGKFGGCLGPKVMFNTGIDLNEADCQKIGFTYYSISQYIEPPTQTGYRCVIAEGWMTGKTILNNVKCTETCQDGRGCGVEHPFGSSWAIGSVGFDGYKIVIPAPENVWRTSACSGNIIVKFPQAEIPPEIIVEPIIPEPIIPIITPIIEKTQTFFDKISFFIQDLIDRIFIFIGVK